jgi:hypothetical protein
MHAKALPTLDEFAADADLSPRIIDEAEADGLGDEPG